MNGNKSFCGDKVSMKKFTCYKLYDMSILGSKNFANIIRNTENFSNFVLCSNSDYGL